MPQLTLPGLIDVHVHLRVPGGEQKETYATGTAAALAGGVTTILDMPNTSPPTTDASRLAAKRALAAAEARCDVGLFAGASTDNVDTVFRLAEEVCALKIYVSTTFGPLRVADWALLEAHISHWPAHKPIVVHAEGPLLPRVLLLGARYGKHIHVAHVALQAEIEAIITARERGAYITCEVTPHHLVLTVDDIRHLGPWGDVRPKLASPADRAALWHHLPAIDCIATDHAPHTIAEKTSANPPPGLPGLETMLPLLLTAVDDGRLELARLIELTSTNPARIFNLPRDPRTSVEVEVGPRYRLPAQGWQTKVDWTPFAGYEVAGRVLRTTLRGTHVYEAGHVLASPGSGRILFGQQVSTSTGRAKRYG
ncbi:MAG: amidohydrolase family protein [Herpetosiphonaceae bacterium]|nr:amidohydrolase family protein [Herpetosiphonaceae bacterium]